MSARPLPLLLSSLLTAGGVAVAAPVFSAQAPSAPSAPLAEPAPLPTEDVVLVGEVTREQVEESVSDWVQAEVEATPDKTASQALTALQTKAEVTVYLGTWCDDSRREIARLWRASDFGGGVLPFKVTYVAVDREKKEPADRLAGVDLQYVPTVVVKRGGREVGRIVETSPHGIETDLLALVTGKATGVISARTDLAPETQQP
jgi:hypothetical protein